VEQEFKWKGTTTCRERRKTVNIHEKNQLKTLKMKINKKI
jgi:hypothetical protein